eukprot:Tamp_14711.p1 GENE.Tamp_14711~~Tamp_14711.p1  ORF type:complete len:516 (-),score=99.97 Tamp_14711:58-1581(-)
MPPANITQIMAILALFSTQAAFGCSAMAAVLAAEVPGYRAVLRLRGGVDQFNMNDGFRNERPSPMAIKRIQSELAGLQKEPSDFFRARPLNEDLLDWHFVLLGAENSVFEKGLFHGRIMLDQDYPMKPPRVIFLTETGRFEVGVPVCLTITSHHAECWQPTWDIRTALTAIRAFMETPSDGALGGLDCADEDRMELTLRSRTRPSCFPCLADCARPALALKMHIKMHEELAEAACIHMPATNSYKVVQSQGCLLGVLSSLLRRAAVATLMAARLFGGLDVGEVVREVWGPDGGDALSVWMEENQSTAIRELRVQVSNLTETNLKLERAVAYKEQQRLQCLGEAAAAEERAVAAENEVSELVGHLDRVLKQLSLRDQTLSDMARLDNPLAATNTGGMDPREPKSAAEAERLLKEMTEGKPLSEDEIKDRLAKAKEWALERLQTAETQKGDSDDDDEESIRRRDRLRSRLEAISAGGAFKGMTLGKSLKSGVDLDACVPKWLEDMSGIS